MFTVLYYSQTARLDFVESDFEVPLPESVWLDAGTIKSKSTKYSPGMSIRGSIVSTSDF